MIINYTSGLIFIRYFITPDSTICPLNVPYKSMRGPNVLGRKENIHRTSTKGTFVLYSLKDIHTTSTNGYCLLHTLMDILAVSGTSLVVANECKLAIIRGMCILMLNISLVFFVIHIFYYFITGIIVNNVFVR